MEYIVGFHKAVTMCIEEISKKFGWNYIKALDAFYNSETYKYAEDRCMDIFHYSPIVWADEFEKEVLKH